VSIPAPPGPSPTMVIWFVIQSSKNLFTAEAQRTRRNRKGF
jgi:hypothetical protein